MTTLPASVGVAPVPICLPPERAASEPDKDAPQPAPGLAGGPVEWVSHRPASGSDPSTQHYSVSSPPGLAARKAAGASPPQAELTCPPTLPADVTPPGFRPAQATKTFHCGFHEVVEDRKGITPEHPQKECVYDENGQLVTESHPYKGCRGTDDSYDPNEGILPTLAHIFVDPGGVVWAGPEAFVESRKHGVDTVLNSIKERVVGIVADAEHAIRKLY